MHLTRNTGRSNRPEGGMIRGLALLMGTAAVVAIGCDGGASGPNIADGGGQGASGGFLPIGGTGGSRVPNFDGGIGRPKDPPPINSESVKLIDGRARFVGTHGSACSNGDPDPGQPPVGDRWCAFFRPGEGLGRFDLWVFNLTRAAQMNAPLACNQDSDPGLCRRLTNNLWTGQPGAGPAHPFDHRFDGDTLIFHADARSAPDELYRGPIYAWRPGWAQARQISTSEGITCAGHPRASVALCLDNIEPDPALPLEFDLLAGPISDAPNTQLPKIDRIFPLNADDVSKWSANFSRDGSLFAYSTGTSESNADEVLRIMRTENVASFNPATPGTQRASRFRFSRDGTRVFYLSTYNYSREGSPSGNLVVAPILNPTGTPSIGAASQVEENVEAYIVLGEDDVDMGVGYFYTVANGRGTLRLIPDVANASLFKLIQSNIASALLSGDGRYTFFSRAIDDNTGVSDALIADNAAAALGTEEAPPQVAPSCVLQAALRTDLYGQPFLDESGMVFFTDSVDTQLLVGTGTAADPATCSMQNPFAQRVDFWFPVGNEGLVYSDNTNIDVADLRYVEIPDGTSFKAGGSVLIQQEADRIYSFSQPDFSTVVYQIDTSTDVDGIYMFKTPFPLGDEPSPDAGAPDAGVADAGVDAM